jgi:RNA polymerase sigma-70 factor (ECF subfamily)
MLHMEPQREQALVERAQKGDTEAFGELAYFYLPRIYNVCLGLTGNRQDAEDSSQETLLKAYHALSGFKEQASLYTWLYRIAVNVCFDLKRSQKNHSIISLDQTYGEEEVTLQLEDPLPLPDEQAISQELGQHLREAIASLRQDLRDVLVLRDIEGFSYDEIGKLLKLSPGTVKSRLFRARRQVMDHLNAKPENPASRWPEQNHTSDRPRQGKGGRRC